MLICDISTTHKYGKLALDLLLEPLDIGWQEMVVLLALQEAPDASHSLLSALLQTDKGNITKLLQRMEKKGLLCRNLSEKDSRVKRNTLSHQGKGMIPSLRQTLKDWEALCLSGLTEEEIRIFSKASQTILHNTLNLVKKGSKEAS